MNMLAEETTTTFGENEGANLRNNNYLCGNQRNEG